VASFVEMVNVQINGRDDSRVWVLFAAMSLTIVFYFVSPQKFLENLGYAVLAILSLLEAGGMVHSRTNANHSAENDSTSGLRVNCSRAKHCSHCGAENPKKARYCLRCGLRFGFRSKCSVYESEGT
jgi:hypothetical protein